MQEAADKNNLKLQKFSALTRANGELAWQVNQAIFKAAKPVDGKPSIFTVADASGSQTLVKLLAVVEGEMSESDKAKQKLAETNIAKAFGQADFNSVLNSLQADADITVNVAEK
jgi:peptidyl-prolyl cis-trans isomerase D